jgi:bla regulator protein blaR1
MNWQIFFADGPAADWILLTAFHSLWLSVVGFIVVHIWKFKAPAVRSTWCTFTLMLLLLLPLLTWFAPQAVIRPQSVQKESITTHAEVSNGNAPLINELLGIERPGPHSRTNQWKTWISQFGLLWLAVTLGCIGKLLYQLVLLKGYTNFLREIKDDRVAAILQEINQSLGIRLRPKFYVSLTITSPVAVRIREPIVILPAALYQSIEDEELRAILLHELAHIYHSDHSLGLMQQLVKALYWWNPLVYSVCDTLTAAREEVSDNYAIRAMGSAATYATLLVRLIEEAPLINRMPCVSGMASPYQALQARISNILSEERDLAVKAGKGMISAISAAALLMCGIVCIGSQVKIFGTEAAVFVGPFQETNADRPSFEVATIKPSSSARIIPGGPAVTADYWAWNATTLKRLVNIAYLVREWQMDWQIKGGTPGWVDSQLWDVEGRVNPPDFYAASKPDGPEKAQRRSLRLQSLLEDRFKLQVERQTRQAPVYNLVVAKGGPKIKLDEDQSPIVRSASPTPQSSTSVGAFGLPRGGMWDKSGFGTPSIEAHAVPIERLISSLLNRAGRPIIDCTNLKGLYTFQIKWSEEESGTGDSPLARRSLSLSPAFFTALQEQLGLRLESAKGPVEFLVIKSVQKPDDTK